MRSRARESPHEYGGRSTDVLPDSRQPIGSRLRRYRQRPDQLTRGIRTRARDARVREPRKLPSPRLGSRSFLSRGYPLKPGMHFLGTIHLPGALDIRVGAQRFLNEVLKPLFAFGLTL